MKNKPKISIFVLVSTMLATKKAIAGQIMSLVPQLFNFKQDKLRL